MMVQGINFERFINFKVQSGYKNRIFNQNNKGWLFGSSSISTIKTMPLSFLSFNMVNGNFRNSCKIRGDKPSEDSQNI